MKKTIYLLFFLFLLTYFTPAQAQLLGNPQKIADRLQTQMVKYPTAYHKVMIMLKDYVDVAAMDKDFYARKASLQERTYQVITTLKAKAEATQPAVIGQMKNLSGVRNIQPAWITNMIFAEMTADAVHTLSMREDLMMIDWDAPAMQEEYEVKCLDIKRTSSVGGREKGLTAINAHLMWAMGYTGYGKVAMSIDTGVDPTHPAIDNQYRGNYVPANQAWHESNAGGTTPRNCGDHGTHTVGTMVGLNEQTKDTIGVAFGGTWIASPGLCSWSNKYLDFQWALDPDNNPNTIVDQPTAINNSWYDGSLTNECTNTAIINSFNAVEAAGIAIVFSAGNEGSGVSTITPPKNISTDLVNVFCVGNLNANLGTYPINSSSSRGPSICGGTGSLLIKPEVSAPGTDVRSCITGNAYDVYTGTSMASPHVTGAILLLKEAFPTLTGTQLKLALYYTCLDLGDPGEDNDYGMGLINVKAAYDYLVQQGNTPAPANNLVNAAASNILNIPLTTTCNPNVQPVFEFYNFGINDLTSATIWFSYDNTITDSIAWTGNLAHGDMSAITLPIQLLSSGVHDLHIIVKFPNGVADAQPLNNSISRQIEIVPSYTPNGVSVFNVCNGGNASLTATSAATGTIAWYDAPVNGNLVGTGSPFLSPLVTGIQTYYVDLMQTENTAKVDTTGGAGAYQNNSSPGLLFNVMHPCVIKQVTVYAQSAGTRIVVLRDNAGTILKSDTIDMVAGQQVLDLNFEVQSGNDYVLGLTGVLCKLYRNDAGISYPYQINEVISIHNSTVGTGRYYYFYNWVVEHGSPCGRNPIAVAPGNGNFTTTFTPSATSVYLNTGANVTFTDNSTGASNWAWNFGDGNLSAQQNPTHAYTQAGIYTVTLTADNGACIDADSATIYVGYAVNNVNLLDKNIRIYPNPTQGQLIIETTSYFENGTYLKIYDIMGKEVYMTTLSNNSQEIDISHLAAGTYYLSFVNKDNISTTKIMVTE